MNLLVYAAVFLSLIYPYSDYDWGWHLRYGEELVKNGQLLRTDMFSWTMKGYPWVNHEWLYDPILYWVNNYGGYIGLSVLAAIIGLGCFYLLTRGYKLKSWQLLLTGFFFSQLIEPGLFQGLRGQVVGYLPLAALMVILLKGQKNSRYLWMLPPLFLLWVNLHGTFLFGLLITAIFLGYFLLTNGRKWKTYVGIGVLTLAVTLINPFGLRVYVETLKHTNNAYLQSVTEWLPLSTSCSYCNLPTAAIYGALLLLAIGQVRSAGRLPLTLAALVLAWPAVNQRRNLPVFGIATFPLFLLYLEQLRIDWDRYKITRWAVVVIALITIEYTLFTRLPGFNFYKYSEADYCQYGPSCSPGLAQYLTDNPPGERGFNMYDWGGYLIGKRVPAEVFVDGRMHLWEAKNGYMPFADYLAIYYRAEIPIFNSYDFRFLAVPPGSEIGKAIMMGRAEGLWQIAYQDSRAVYWVRSK